MISRLQGNAIQRGVSNVRHMSVDKILKGVLFSVTRYHLKLQNKRCLFLSTVEKI